MGVIHKLKPEVIDFVLQKKSIQPNLSCRGLAAIASEQFQSKISKSSVNTLFKNKGLSMPVGRRKRPESDKQQLLVIEPVVKCVKIELDEQKKFFLDSQMHALWHSESIPQSLSTPLSGLENKLNQSQPIILLMAPGYKKPRKELFYFIQWLQNKVIQKAKISFYGQENRIIMPKNVQSGNVQSEFGIFCVWPWQFLEYRIIKSQTEYKKALLQPINREFLLAGAEVEIINPINSQKNSFQGCLFKAKEQDTALIILATMNLSVEEIAGRFLEKWPDPEASFRDLSQKIEALARGEPKV